MKKLLYILTASILVIFISCTDEVLLVDNTRNTTVFSVYECEDNFTENSIATSYVSIGAQISIWKLTQEGATPAYKLIDVLTTGEDGQAIYKHSRENFYYSVDKITEDERVMSNILSPMNNERMLANSFEVAGIFSSTADVDNYYKYNLPHLAKNFVPRIGGVKFKDTNSDDIIDIKDSISKVFLYNPNREEVVYIALDPNR